MRLHGRLPISDHCVQGMKKSGRTQEKGLWRVMRSCVYEESNENRRKFENNRTNVADGLPVRARGFMLAGDQNCHKLLTLQLMGYFTWIRKHIINCSRSILKYLTLGHYHITRNTR